MLYNLIVDDCGIDRHEHEPFVMPFYTVNYSVAKDAEDAVRRAVNKYLISPEGLNARRHNCGYFNWGDVACNVPDRYFVAEGLFPIPMKEKMSTVVIHDEGLVGAEDEYFLESVTNIRLTQDNVATIIEKAVRDHNGSRFTFAITDCENNNLSDYIWDALSRNNDLDLYENENNDLKYTMSLTGFLHGFRRWHENGFDTTHAVRPDGTVCADSISAEEADRILRFALLREEEVCLLLKI